MPENVDPIPEKTPETPAPEAAQETSPQPTEGVDAKAEPKQHDLMLKTAFHHFLPDLIELVRPDFAECVDLSSVRFLEQETFTDFPRGTRHVADLVAELTSKAGEDRLVLVQTEVEGEFRSAMDERSFYYYLYLRIKFQIPVLVIVVFLKGGHRAGKGEEKGKNLTMREFVDLAECVEVCRFRYVSFFLELSQTEDFLKRPQPLAAGLAGLMSSEWEPDEKRLHCMRTIAQADVDEARQFLLAELVRQYVELDEAQAARYAAKIETDENKEVQKMVFTWEDTLAAREAKGKAEGKAEGEAEGEAKGEARGLRKSVLRVLRHRLKAISVPAKIREKLDAIQSIERLEEILDQATTVNSIDELVLEYEPAT